MKNNTPRRKRLNKSARLTQAKVWIKSYNGKKLVKGYSKWFGVDTLCALRELKLSGVTFDPDTEAKVIKGFHQRCESKRRAKRPKALDALRNTDADDNFAFIAGYTENGFPFGVTHDEWRAANEVSGLTNIDGYADLD